MLLKKRYGLGNRLQQAERLGLNRQRQMHAVAFVDLMKMGGVASDAGRAIALTAACCVANHGLKLHGTVLIEA